MSFSTGSSCVVNMKYSEDEISAMIAESREACKHLCKLGMIRKTVATHRFKELRHLRAVEKLATWRMTYGFDRLEDGNDQWVHGPLPLTPEQITASMWADLKELKGAISISEKERSRQRVKSFFNELDRGTASFTDVEFAILKRIVERRGRDAARVTVAPIDTAQPCSTRSRSPETSFDARVYMEKNDEGKMDPGRDRLESPSAGTDFETPGQQCPPNWEKGQTTVAGCLPVGVSSNFWGNTFPLAEIAVRRRADSEITTPPTASTTVPLQTSRKPKDKKTTNEENKQFDSSGKGEEPPPWKAGVPVFFSFSWGTSRPGCPLLVSRAFLLVCILCIVLIR